MSARGNAAVGASLAISRRRAGGNAKSQAELMPESELESTR